MFAGGLPTDSNMRAADNAIFSPLLPLHVGCDPYSKSFPHLKLFQRSNEDLKFSSRSSMLAFQSKIGGHQDDEKRPIVGIQNMLRWFKTRRSSSVRHRRRYRGVSSSSVGKLHRIPRGGESIVGIRALENRMGMYCWCLFVVLVWIATGTLFYSKYNGWPLPQSFFYAVDAGMSIGFCTDVAETKVGSRAFTIVYILLGASCVGGALALFIQDIMEGIVALKNDKFEYLLAQHAAKRYEVDGSLTYENFRNLLEEWMDRNITDDSFHRICQRLDPFGKGSIKSAKFVERCLELDKFLTAARGPLLHSKYLILRKIAQMGEMLRELFDGTRRIFTVFIAWLFTGIWWGHKRQGWDVITSIHFAVSALSTGGLTGPQVNSGGILPTEPALFCGVYCLFGIPLFALTLGHFARILVEGYVAAAEENAVKRSIYHPLDVTEFEYAKNLCSKDDEIHLSDFLVLQLLRQGKIDIRTVSLIKAQFDALDTDGSGKLSLEKVKSLGIKDHTDM